MRSKNNRLISFLLTLVMIASCLPLHGIEAKADSVQNSSGGVDVLDALGINSNEAPKGYDPNSVDNPYGRDTIEVTLYTGLRAGEIFSLQQSSLDIQNKYVHVFDTKSSLNRSVHLNTPALEILQRHVCLNRPYLFFNDQTCSPIRFVSRIFTSAVERAGLNPPDVDRRNKVVFHTLRHTFASWLVQDGTPLAVVAQLLGHANIRMTMRYAHLAPGQGYSAVEKIAF